MVTKHNFIMLTFLQKYSIITSQNCNYIFKIHYIILYLKGLRKHFPALLMAFQSWDKHFTIIIITLLVLQPCQSLAHQHFLMHREINILLNITQVWLSRCNWHIVKTTLTTMQRNQITQVVFTCRSSDWQWFCNMWWRLADVMSTTHS